MFEKFFSWIFDEHKEPHSNERRAPIAETLRPNAACGTRSAAGENGVLKRGEYTPYNTRNNTRTRGSDVSAFFRDLKGFNVCEREAACGFAVMR